MKLVYLVGLALVLSACDADVRVCSTPNTPQTYRGYRMIESTTYAVDDSLRGVTCYLSTRRWEAISCVKTFTPDSTR